MVSSGLIHGANALTLSPNEPRADYAATHTINPYFVVTRDGFRRALCQDCGWYPGLGPFECTASGTRMCLTLWERMLYASGGR